MGAVMGFAASVPVVYQFGALQDRQVLGDRRLRDPGAASQRMHGLLAIPSQPLEDRPAGRIGKRFEDVLGKLRHGETITIWLWVVKAEIERFFFERIAAAQADRQKMEFPASSCYLHSMEITVTIPDEVAETARALGMTPESYVVQMVVGEEAKPEPQLSTEERLANLEQFFRDMTRNSHKIPHLSDEALSRESFYQDHD